MGGNWEERLDADIDLFRCVYKSTGFGMAILMFIGVRIGGTPFLPTPWRWGFGHKWPKYKP
jgi:hypothetical protein